MISFEFSAFIKAPTKTHRSVYDYEKGDFEGLRTALSAINLSAVLGCDDINIDWQQWRDTFLAAVSDYIPMKRLKGRNPLPWINGTILNLMKKKDSVRQKLKKSSSSHLREKFKNLRAEVKRLLRDSCDKFFGSLEGVIRSNPKRFWSVLKQKSKSHGVPDQISMPTVPSTTADQTSPLPRVTAGNPAAIANLFNRYFASVFTTSSVQHNNSFELDADPVLSNPRLSESEVQAALQSLDVTKATGADGISARLLRDTAPIIAPSLCSLFNKSLSLGIIPHEWKLAKVVPVYTEERGQGAHGKLQTDIVATYSI